MKVRSALLASLYVAGFASAVAVSTCPRQDNSGSLLDSALKQLWSADETERQIAKGDFRMLSWHMERGSAV